jgi:hypothetical protein
VTIGAPAPYIRGMKCALAAVLVLAAAGCGGSSSPQALHGTAPPPSKAKTSIFARALLRQARAWGDPHPTDAVVVRTTRRKALRIEYDTGGISGLPATPAYLVVAHGHFVAKDTPRPRGAKSPTGTILVLTFDASTNRSLGVGLLRKAHPLGRAGKSEPLPLNDPSGGEAAARPRITYPLIGLTLTPAPSGYRPSVSRTAVLDLFRRSGLLASGSRRKPIIHLWTVGDGRPADGGSPSWVLTFRHTIPTSLGVPKTPVCTTVAIYDLSVRVWTWDFQNCGEGKRASCDAGCTPANQSALDAAATYAETAAGASHVYAGDRVDDAANQVVVYLVHASASVLAELRTRHPGIYVIHNDAPRTWHAVTQLQKSLDWRALKAKGIDIVSSGPTGAGYLQVGVSSSVAKAQAYFDAKYGRGVVRVEHAEPAVPVGFGVFVAPRTVPRWAEKCLPKRSERLGPAPRYLGLTPAAANRLDQHGNRDLVYAGGGGHCFSFDDDVNRTHPIAVVISTRLLRQSGARIIAAVRAAPGWQPGRLH